MLLSINNAEIKDTKIEVIIILLVEELTGFSSEAVLPSTVLILGYGVAEVDPHLDWSIILDPLYPTFYSQHYKGFCIQYPASASGPGYQSIFAELW